jgi:hypothetical protein
LDTSTGKSILKDVVGNRNCVVGVPPIGTKQFSKFPVKGTDNTPNFLADSHMTCGDHSQFSISTTGTLTIEFWAQPTETTWSSSVQYVYLLG